ncbi:MAG: radical SAM protein [Bryobacteraceae bacterium]|nr:radical SAM protein [Bryobacteraceae bacterium]
MARSILIQPPLRFGVETKTSYIEPPLGLAYVAACLLEGGRQTAILDMPMDELPVKAVLDRIAGGVDWIGLTCTTLNYGSARSVARAVKARFPTVPVVLGGPHATFTAEQILSEPDPVFDVVVQGEAENIVLPLDQAFESRQWRTLISDIAGVCCRLDGVVRSGGRTAYVGDLDALPFPARQLLPMSKYAAYQPHTPIITSRGCPFHCAFCSAGQMHGQTFRARSAENVVDEVERVVRVYGFSTIHFSDDTFSMNSRRVRQICQIMRARGIKCRWLCETRAETLTAELLQDMAAAGCFLVTMGVESGCQKLNDRSGRRSHVGHVRKAVQMCREAGIESRIGFVIGLPGETADTLERSLEFALDVRADHVAFGILTPYPGTDIARFPEAYGVRILSRDYDNYRHDSANVQVGELGPEDLEQAWLRLVADANILPGEMTQPLIPRPKAMCDGCEHLSRCFAA